MVHLSVGIGLSQGRNYTAEVVRGTCHAVFNIWLLAYAMGMG